MSVEMNKVIMCLNHLFFSPHLHFGINRLVPPDQDAVGRIHPAGSGDSVQQRQGAGPAEPAGQIHEKCRYQASKATQRSSAADVHELDSHRQQVYSLFRISFLFLGT